jgi:hypothetical protein
VSGYINMLPRASIMSNRGESLLVGWFSRIMGEIGSAGTGREDGVRTCRYRR